MKNWLNLKLNQDFTLFELNDKKTLDFYLKNINFFILNFPYFKDIENISMLFIKNKVFCKQFLKKIKIFMKVMNYSVKEEIEDDVISSSSSLNIEEENFYEISDSTSSTETNSSDNISLDSFESNDILINKLINKQINYFNFPNHKPKDNIFQNNKKEKVYKNFYRVFSFYIENYEIKEIKEILNEFLENITEVDGNEISSEEDFEGKNEGNNNNNIDNLDNIDNNIDNNLDNKDINILDINNNKDNKDINNNINLDNKDINILDNKDINTLDNKDINLDNNNIINNFNNLHLKSNSIILSTIESKKSKSFFYLKSSLISSLVAKILIFNFDSSVFKEILFKNKSIINLAIEEYTENENKKEIMIFDEIKKYKNYLIQEFLKQKDYIEIYKILININNDSNNSNDLVFTIPENLSLFDLYLFRLSSLNFINIKNLFSVSYLVFKYKDNSHFLYSFFNILKNTKEKVDLSFLKEVLKSLFYYNCVFLSGLYVEDQLYGFLLDFYKKEGNKVQNQIKEVNSGEFPDYKDDVESYYALYSVYDKETKFPNLDLTSNLFTFFSHINSQCTLLEEAEKKEYLENEAEGFDRFVVEKMLEEMPYIELFKD